MTLHSTYVLVCIPDGSSHDAVQGPHLLVTCEARQVGSQSLTELLGFLPGALPAQPLVVKHLERGKNNSRRLLRHFCQNALIVL